jgi:hypothetical protein
MRGRQDAADDRHRTAADTLAALTWCRGSLVRFDNRRCNCGRSPSVVGGTSWSSHERLIAKLAGHQSSHAVRFRRGQRSGRASGVREKRHMRGKYPPPPGTAQLDSTTANSQAVDVLTDSWVLPADARHVPPAGTPTSVGILSAHPRFAEPFFDNVFPAKGLSHGTNETNTANGQLNGA